jgi:hypothetical protein
MEKIRKLVLWLVILGPIHLAEHFYDVKRHLAAYYGWFDPAFADAATAILMTLVGTLLALALLAALHEGTPSLVVAGLFGLFGAQSIHHVFEALLSRSYNPGLVTSIPYLIVGNMLVKAVWRELRQQRVQGAVAARA